MTFLVTVRKLIMAVIMASVKARNLQSKAQKCFVTLCGINATVMSMTGRGRATRTLLNRPELENCQFLNVFSTWYGAADLGTVRISIPSIRQIGSRAEPPQESQGSGASEQRTSPASSNERQPDSSERHWLDRRLPGARQWLENKNKTLWLTAIAERCRQNMALEGRESLIRDQIERRFAEMMTRHNTVASDDRSQTHLNMVCLMVATEQTLSPWIRDSGKRLEIIQAQMGDYTSPILRFLLRFTLYLSLDPFKSSQRRLNGLQLDYGPSFQTRLHASDMKAQLEVHKCFYNELLAMEGCQHLLSACCCSQDRIWFEKLGTHGVEFERTAWLGFGGTQCCLTLSKRTDKKALPWQT